MNIQDAIKNAKETNNALKMKNWSDSFSIYLITDHFGRVALGVCNLPYIFTPEQLTSDEWETTDEHRYLLDDTESDSVIYKSIEMSSDRPCLTLEELMDVLSDVNRSKFAIYASSDLLSQVLTIWRGDATILSIPFSDFQSIPENSHPNFNKVSIIDHGQTIKLGDYEASMEAIIREYNLRL